MPLFLSVLTGILFGFQSVLVKFALLKRNQVQILKFLFCTAGLLLLPFALYKIPSIQMVPFSISTSISLLINIAAYLLLFTAIKISPISIVMPYIGFTPLFLTLNVFFILDEKTGSVQFLGIFLILIGGFVLQLPSTFSQKNKFNLKHLFNREERGIYLALAAAFLWSISASVEKIAVLSSSPEFYGASIHLALGLVFVIIARNKRYKTEIKDSGTVFLLLLFIGVVSAGLAWSQLTAIRLTQVSTVIAFKRSGILVSGLFGLFYFKEGYYLKTISATLIILCGAILISLYAQ